MLSYLDVDEQIMSRVTAGTDELAQTIARRAADWQQACDAIPAPLLLVTPDGRLRRINLAGRELYGLPYDQLVGRPLAELRGDPPHLDVVRLVDELFASGEPMLRRVSHAGETWEIEGSIARSPEGEMRVVVQVRDVSEYVRLQESLARSQTMAALGAVVGGVAHEVRNPLFALSAMVDALESRVAGAVDNPASRYLPLFRRELERMKLLMQDLLDYGRPNHVAAHELDLALVVAQAIENAAAPAAAAGVKVMVAGTAPLLRVEGDSASLVQAVAKVLENAIQHSPANGTVEIELRADHDAARGWVGVRDHGPGFVPHELSQVFEPFYSRRAGGTGLGLSIAARVIEEHSGELLARNHVAGGALVELGLPLLDPPTADEDVFS